VGHLDQFDAREGSQQGARLVVNIILSPQITGVMIGHQSLDFPPEMRGKLIEAVGEILRHMPDRVTDA
jgi:hypothetical protein